MLPIMKPMVCIGPPLPSRKPPPHGIRHCQRYVPALFRRHEAELLHECGPEVQGEVPHAELLNSAVLGEATGTNTCRPGIANVCPTLHVFQESIVANVLAGPRGWPTVLNC